jgi:hypothetical protein
MRRSSLLAGLALTLAACGGETGGDRAAEPVVDAAPRADGANPMPREDAFRPTPDVALPDARGPVLDASAPPEVGPPDAAPDGGPPPDAAPDALPGPAGGPPGALAAGAAPLRSARYRLFAIAGPAAAAGSTLTSDRYRLESGAVLWRAPVSAPPPESP